MRIRSNRTNHPRRRLLSQSARLVAATTAAAVLPARTSAERREPTGPPEQPGNRSHVTHLNPSTLSTPRGYTHLVEVRGGRTLYISGQVALDRSGALVGVGDLRAQTQQVFENLRLALDAVGATFRDVVKINVYMLDASQVQVMRDVREKFIAGLQPPASTLVEVRRLAREEFLIEIEAIASLAT